MKEFEFIRKAAKNIFFVAYRQIKRSQARKGLASFCFAMKAGNERVGISHIELWDSPNVVQAIAKGRGRLYNGNKSINKNLEVRREYFKASKS